MHRRVMVRARTVAGMPEPGNLIVDGYVEINVPLFERYAADALRLAQLQPGERVLDVAAGPGALSLLAGLQARLGSGPQRLAMPALLGLARRPQALRQRFRPA